MTNIDINHRCPPTIFCDIDGTIWAHEWNITHSMSGIQNLLPGAFQNLLEWHRQGFQVILTTGRPEFLRETTERQLQELGLFYNRLIMDCGPGPRVLINDTDTDAPKAFAVNLERDEGMEDVKINYTQQKDL